MFLCKTWPTNCHFSIWSPILAKNQHFAHGQYGCPNFFESRAYYWAFKLYTKPQLFCRVYTFYLLGKRFSPRGETNLAFGAVRLSAYRCWRNIWMTSFQCVLLGLVLFVLFCIVFFLVLFGFVWFAGLLVCLFVCFGPVPCFWILICLILFACLFVFIQLLSFHAASSTPHHTIP